MPFDTIDCQLEVKEIDADGRIVGYAAVYGNVDRGGDVILPGAFAKSCERNRVEGYRPKMLWQHDPSQVIGVWDTITEDSKGLLTQGRVLSKVAKGAEVLELLRAKAIDGLSIGYKTIDAEMRPTERGAIREIKEAELWETSVVTFPMNTEATVTDVKQLQSPREVERLLIKSGVPSRFAKLLSLYGFEGAMARLNKESRDEAEAKATQEAISSLLANLNGLKEALNVR